MAVELENTTKILGRNKILKFKNSRFVTNNSVEYSISDNILPRLKDEIVSHTNKEL